MHNKSTLFLFILSILFLSSSCNSNKDKKYAENLVKDSVEVYQPNWKSIKENYKDPAWFNNLMARNGTQEICTWTRIG